MQVYELGEGQTAKARVPTGKGTDVAGVVEATLKDGEVTVSVVSGEVALASLSYFASGQVKKVDVGKGQKTASLRV